MLRGRRKTKTPGYRKLRVLCGPYPVFFQEQSQRLARVDGEIVVSSSMDVLGSEPARRSPQRRSASFRLFAQRWFFAVICDFPKAAPEAPHKHPVAESLGVLKTKQCPSYEMMVGSERVPTQIGDDLEWTTAASREPKGPEN